MTQMVSGNQAVAFAALESGIELASGYPGTPSTEALSTIYEFCKKNNPSPYVEWSTNEKVAFEVAAGAAWTGKRALTTMKMSGANVASDSIMSVAYSGTRGGLVIYIADDPGAEAGMPEQDTRLFALFSGLPVLDPSSPGQAFRLTKFAFELSESSRLPVILRSITSVAHTKETIEADFLYHPIERKPEFKRDILRFTKAGADICVNQHITLLERLKKAEEIIHKQKINTIRRNEESTSGGNCSRESSLSVISAGVLNRYVDEAMSSKPGIYSLKLEAVYPLDNKMILEILNMSERIVIFEELEPVIEMLIRSLASTMNWQGQIIGKMDGVLPRTGRYSYKEIIRGLNKLINNEPESKEDKANTEIKVPAYKHPITFCAGCPHRGTYLALNRALKKMKLKKEETLVTGDIGCTILGMNPPIDSCWTELSMGSSIGLAQGFSRSGFKAPIIAAIGDSTFFHAGIPPLINAVQHNTDILVIILDNGWTSMTGFQINPGTDTNFQGGDNKKVEIEKIIMALGVDFLEIINPFDQESSIDALCKAINSKGVRVILSQEECALTRIKREGQKGTYKIDSKKCTFCRACLRETGCPALIADTVQKLMSIDSNQCTGCGLCESSCSFDAIYDPRVKELA